MLAALASVSVVWIAAWARWWWGDTVVPWDSKNQFYAFFRFMAGELSAGRAPWWNPYHYGGHPSIADPQSLVFQPVFLLWALFDDAPSLRVFDTLVFAHLLVGGLAMVSIGRRHGWPAAACVLAACVFMLGGPASGRLNHTGIIIAYGLFPLAWLLAEVALSRRSVRPAIGFALVAGVIVLGRNQVSLMVALTLAGLMLREMINDAAPWAWLKSRWHLLAAMAVVLVAVIGVPMLLTLQFAQLSNRPVIALDSALEASLHPVSFASAVMANILGQHAGDYFYWGPGVETLPEVAATDDSFNYLFVGAAPIVLLFWLGVAGRQLWEPGLRTWTIVLGLAVMFSLGRYAPLFPLVFEHVPGFSFFRRPNDGAFLAVIAVAYLGGALLAAYAARGMPKPVPLATAAALSAATLVIAGALTFANRTGHGWAALVELARGMPVLVVVLVALAIARGPEQRRHVGMLLAAITAAELVVWNAASRLNAEDRPYYQVLERANGEEARALRLLDQDIARRRGEGQRPRVEIAGVDGPWQNLGMVRRLEAINGYNPLRIGTYDRFVAPGEIAAFLDKRAFPPSFPSYDSALARAAGLEYLVLGQPIEESVNLRRPKGIETLMSGPKVWIYRLPAAMTRVRFVSRVRLVDGETMARGGGLERALSADGVLIDREQPPRAHYVAGDKPPGSAQITAWQATRVEVEVEARRAGVLVLGDAYYPGWVAELDGVRAPILRADVLFRAVEVPPGKHRVVFSYRPLSLENLTEALVRLGRKRETAPGGRR